MDDALKLGEKEEFRFRYLNSSFVRAVLQVSGVLTEICDVGRYVSQTLPCSSVGAKTFIITVSMCG